MPGGTRPGDLIIATAGHVSHGKSTLVHALTGHHPDRLPEERRRGMTLALGYAVMPGDDARRVAFIDVPGHERLVRTKVAGLNAIDASIVVVAADDGPMPQTREHLRILALLGIPQVILAITRIDRVDADWLAVAREAATDAAESAGIVPVAVVEVSATTGVGLGDLRDGIDSLLPAPADAWDGAAWLPIDRVFQVPGSGTVVTGTLVSGRLDQGQSVVVSGHTDRFRIRRIECWNATTGQVHGPARVALNLVGPGTDRIRPGMVLSDGPPATTRHADVWLRRPVDGPRPGPGERIRVLSGTADHAATIRLLSATGTGTSTDRTTDREFAAQLRFDGPVPLRPGERFIVRRASPALTIGGGVVLDIAPPRPTRDPARQSELRALASGDPLARIRSRADRGPVASVALLDGLPPSADAGLDALIRSGDVVPLGPDGPSGAGWLVGRTWMDAWWTRTRDLVASFHRDHPARTGLPLTALSRKPKDRDGTVVLVTHAIRSGWLERHGETVALADFRPSLSPGARSAIGTATDRNGDRPVPSWLAALGPDDRALLLRRGEVISCGDGVLVSAPWFATAVRQTLTAVSEGGPITLAAARALLGVSRDLAQAVLEQADGVGATRRVGDVRERGPRAGAWDGSGPGGQPPEAIPSGTGEATRGARRGDRASAITGPDPIARPAGTRAPASGT